MDKKYLIAGVVAALVTVLGGSVSADLTYTFTDTIPFTSNDLSLNPYWTGADSHAHGKWIVQASSPFIYQHDIADWVNFAEGDFVTDATLTLEFHDDDNNDKVGTSYDNREYVTLAFDGGGWVELAGGEEIDQGLYDLIVNVDWLNDDDGILGVSVGVWNPSGTGDIYLRTSTLSGTAAVVPIPAAVLLGMLGLGVAGWRLRKLV